jgi:hypothetical protein
VVDGPTESVSRLDAGVLVSLFEVLCHVQGFRDADLVVGFLVSLRAGHPIEARDAEEEDLGGVAEAAPDTAPICGVFFLAAVAGQVEVLFEGCADGVLQGAAFASFGWIHGDVIEAVLVVCCAASSGVLAVACTGSARLKVGLDERIVVESVLSVMVLVIEQRYRRMMVELTIDIANWRLRW